MPTSRKGLVSSICCWSFESILKITFKRDISIKGLQRAGDKMSQDMASTDWEGNVEIQFAWRRGDQSVQTEGDTQMQSSKAGFSGAVPKGTAKPVGSSDLT